MVIRSTTPLSHQTQKFSKISLLIGMGLSQNSGTFGAVSPGQFKGCKGEKLQLPNLLVVE